MLVMLMVQVLLGLPPRSLPRPGGPYIITARGLAGKLGERARTSLPDRRSSAGPEEDPVIGEGGGEMLLEVAPVERGARLVGNAVDGREPVREGDQGGPNGVVPLEHGHDLALRRRALDERNLQMTHRAVAIEEVIQDRVMGEVEPGPPSPEAPTDEARHGFGGRPQGGIEEDAPAPRDGPDLGGACHRRAAARAQR